MQLRTTHNMDTKIKIKEEDPLSNNEIEFFAKDVIMKTNGDAVLLDDDCDMAIKTEIKLESPFPDFCSQKDMEFCAEQIKSETVTCKSNCEVNMKVEAEEQTVISTFGSQSHREILPENPIVKVKKYNSDHEDVQIKVEPWWLETEASTSYDNIKNGDLPPVKHSRLNTEAVSSDSGKSILPSAEASNTNLFIAKDCPEYESKEIGITKTPNVYHSHTEQSGKCYNEGEIHNKTLCLKKENFNYKGRRHRGCSIGDKSFTHLSGLKRDNLIHEGKKPYQCKICNKYFTRLYHLKTHILIHEGKKPHQCSTCEKSFVRFTHLKTHIMIHEGKKVHQCKICHKSFIMLSYLKKHNITHEGKKPHQCNICNKSFTQASNLKNHYFIHEGNKPYECKTCDKRFSQLSTLKKHNLVHEGKRVHQCKICGKSFTRLSHLKGHKLIHEGKKPYQCEICNKSYTRLSDVKRHNLLNHSH